MKVPRHQWRDQTSLSLWALTSADGGNLTDFVNDSYGRYEDATSSKTARERWKDCVASSMTIDPLPSEAKKDATNEVVAGANIPT